MYLWQRQNYLVFFYMSKYEKQVHVIYKFDYHIVWVLKYRVRILTGEISKKIDEDIRISELISIQWNIRHGFSLA